MESNTVFAIISIIVTFGIFLTIKIIEHVKLKSLTGSHKATGVILIIIAIAEIIYLAITLRVLSSAIEIVASLSALLIFFAFVYLNKLQNAASGISMALGRIKVGDKIEFEGKTGTIKQVGLVKTIVELDDSEKLLFIPNKKFDEDAYVISNQKFKKH